MARWEFKLPDLGEGVTEGEIVSWIVKAGDGVKEDQPIVEVMTDKATVTITAPKAGTVLETRGNVGEIVPVHTVLVVFELEGGSSSFAAAPIANGTNRIDDGPAATAVGEIKETLPGLAGPGSARRELAGETSAVPKAAPDRSGGGGEHAYFNEKPLATPATRKLARDMNIDLRRVPPGGAQGRVMKSDLEPFARSADPPVDSGSRLTESRVPLRGPSREEPGVADERVPFAGLRRKIAQKMAKSTRTAAHFTFVEECDVTELKALRERWKGPAEEQGVKLSFLPFIVKAVVGALKKHPLLNASLDESTSEMVLHKQLHIGIATATAAGLVVPVVREANRRSVLEIAREIERLATDARDGKSKLEDVTGSTFTITSLGARAGLLATPIINFPEVAILGVHRMKQRPVVKDGRIVIGDVMLLSLSFDHRIVDGHVGAAFAYDVISYLEQPDRMFLEMA
ncbi:MAG: 2-oxo acid dehydrogenase subunit E2 [Myxococcota bacterium]|nr:2-oxo acid dehydrogenase subunit E2 [Myxococcota bacterium]